MLKLSKFYPILDTALLDRAGVPVLTAADALLDAGAGILQLRHKGHFSRAVFDDAERLARLCRQAGALFMVNDRADIAAMLGAGLHLGQDDLPASDARRILPSGAIAGLSTHNERQLLAANAEQVDYVALGPMFSTASKSNPDPVVGISELRRLRSLTARPLVAIGGITRASAASVLEAGADSIAVISDLLPDIRCRAKEWMACT